MESRCLNSIDDLTKMVPFGRNQDRALVRIFPNASNVDEYASDMIGDPNQDPEQARRSLDFLGTITPQIVIDMYSGAKIDQFSYMEALHGGKYCRKAAEVGAGMPDVAPGQIDTCWRLSMMMLQRACNLRVAKFLFADIINEYFQAGVLDKFPDETQPIFETAFKGSRDIRIFDGYFKFMKGHHRLPALSRFISENLNLFAGIPDLMASESIQQLFKLTEVGDVIRLEGIKKAFESNVDSYDFAFSYLFLYMLCYKGDYGNVGKMLAVVKKSLKKNGNDDHEVDYVKSCSKLIPDLEIFFRNNGFYDEGFSSGVMLPGLKKRIGNLHFGENGRELVPDEVIQDLRTVYADENKDCSGYVDYLRFSLFKFYKQSNEAEFLEKLIEASVADELRLPVEFLNICVAKLSEHFYKLGKFGEVIELFRLTHVNAKNPPIRGTAYYLLKSCFEFNVDDGKNAVELKRLGMLVAQQKMPAFATVYADGDYEREIWENYFIPNYFVAKDLIASDYPGSKALDIVKKIVDKDGSNFRNRLVYMSLLASSKKFSKLSSQELKRNWMDLNSSKNSSPDFSAELGAEYVRINQLMLKNFLVEGRFKDIIEVIEACPEFKSEPEFVQALIRAKLYRDVLSEDSVNEAMALLRDLPFEYCDGLDSMIMDARKKLQMVQYDQVPNDSYFHTLVDCIDEDRVDRIGKSDSSRMAFILGSLREFVNSLRGVALEYGKVWHDELGEVKSRNVDYGDPLSLLFKVENVLVEKVANGFEITCQLEGKSADDVDRKRVVFMMDEQFKIADLKNVGIGSDNDELSRVLVKIFEAALVEEVMFIVGEVDLRGVDSILNSKNPKLAEYRNYINAYLNEKEFSESGVEGMAFKNREMVSVIENNFKDIEGEVLSQADLSVGIKSLVDVIRQSRDVDEPYFTYKAVVDRDNALSKTIKFMEIFGSDYACSVLRKMGVSDEKIAEFGLPKSKKNNLVGYHELACFYKDDNGNERTGRISVFLNENGVAEIPGIAKNNPLYTHLWYLTLESLVSKVVPEMGPYVSVFIKKKGARVGDSQDPILKKYPDLPPGQYAQKRWACASLTINGRKPGKQESSSLHPKIATLEKITHAFNLVELASAEGVSQIPLFMETESESKKKGAYSRIDGLFVMNDGVNYVDLDVLTGICDDDCLREIKNDASVNLDGKRLVVLDKIGNEVFAFIQKKLKLQILGPRVYRLPIVISAVEEDSDDEFEVREIDGKLYKLIPAKSCSKNSTFVDGKMVRLKPYKSPCAKFEVHGVKYEATPHKMSDDMRGLYEQSMIDMGPESEDSLYGILYDDESGEILAHAYIGSASFDDSELYNDLSSRVAKSVHDSGKLVLMQMPKVADAVNAEENRMKKKRNLAEILVSMRPNKGFKRGVHVELGKFLLGKRGLQDVATGMLKDFLKIENQRGVRARMKKAARGSKGDLSDFSATAIAKPPVEVVGEEVGSVPVVAVVEQGPSRVKLTKKQIPEFVRNLERHRRISELLGSAPDRYTKKELVTAGSKEVIYEVDISLDEEKEASGLYGSELKIVAKDDPRYAHFALAFDLEIRNRALRGRDEYVLVFVRKGGNWSLPSVARLSLLKNKN